MLSPGGPSSTPPGYYSRGGRRSRTRGYVDVVSMLGKQEEVEEESKDSMPR